MSYTKFTPGPWVIADETDGRASINGPEDQSVAEAWGLRPEVDHKANARLISAAPELYEALLACVEGDFACTDKEAVVMAEEALSKARGES